MEKIKSCSLCQKPGGKVVWQDNLCRIVIPNENIFGLQRIIWNQHIKEVGDLKKKEIAHLFEKIRIVEKSLKKKFSPNKINIASLGNIVPHLHIHIIPRWKTDPWWPNPIWHNIPSLRWKKLHSHSDTFLTISSWEKIKFLVKELRKKNSAHEIKKNSTSISSDFDDVSRHAVIKIKNKIIGSGRLNNKGEIDKIFILSKYQNEKFIHTIKDCLIQESKRLKIH